LVFACLSACSSSAAPDAAPKVDTDQTIPPPIANGGVDAGTDAASSTARADASVDKSSTCVGTFGSALTNAYGRVDGYVTAIVRPQDQQCPMPNRDHVIVEVSMLGAVYRLVVNVQSDGRSADTRVRYVAYDAAEMPGRAWSEGWHTDLTLDYVKTLALTPEKFAPFEMNELSQAITDELTLGEKISVYATSSGGASAHLVHRNGGRDGAIVVHIDAAKPRVLAFHFAEQSF